MGTCVLGGGRFASRLSQELKCALGSASRLITSLLTSVAQRLRRKGVVSVRKFNAFRIGGGTRHVSIGPAAGRHVLMPPGLILACGPDALLGSGFGWPTFGGVSHVVGRGLGVRSLVSALTRERNVDGGGTSDFIGRFFRLVRRSLRGSGCIGVQNLKAFGLVSIKDHRDIGIGAKREFRVRKRAGISFAPRPTLGSVVGEPFSRFRAMILGSTAILRSALRRGSDRSSRSARVGAPRRRIRRGITLIRRTAVRRPLIRAMIRRPLIRPRPRIRRRGPRGARPRTVPRGVITIRPRPSRPIVGSATSSSAVGCFVNVIMFMILLYNNTMTFVCCPSLLSGLATGPLMRRITSSSIGRSIARGISIPTNRSGVTLASDVISGSIMIPTQASAITRAITAAAPTLAAAPGRGMRMRSPTPGGRRGGAITPFRPSSIKCAVIKARAACAVGRKRALAEMTLHFCKAGTL